MPNLQKLFLIALITALGGNSLFAMKRKTEGDSNEPPKRPKIEDHLFYDSFTEASKVKSMINTLFKYGGNGVDIQAPLDTLFFQGEATHVQEVMKVLFNKMRRFVRENSSESAKTFYISLNGASTLQMALLFAFAKERKEDLSKLDCVKLLDDFRNDGLSCLRERNKIFFTGPCHRDTLRILITVGELKDKEHFELPAHRKSPKNNSFCLYEAFNNLSLL